MRTPTPPGVSHVPAQPCPTEHSPALLDGAEALHTIAAVLLLCWHCAAAAALLWASIGLGSNLIQGRLQDCFISYAVNKLGFMCRKCFLMREARATKTACTTCAGATFFQLNVFDMNPPPFDGSLNVNACIRMYWGGLR